MYRASFTFSSLMLCAITALGVEGPLDSPLHSPLYGTTDHEEKPLAVLYARQEFVTYTDPDVNSEVKAVVPMGFEFKVLSESEDHLWYWGMLTPSQGAWAPKEELIEYKPEEPPLVEEVLSKADLRKFHHILAIDKFYSFNFEIWGGKTSLTATSGDNPTLYSAFVFGPGVGQKLGLQNPRRNFLLEAKVLMARESFATSETDKHSVASLGLATALRYLWIHNDVTAGGVYAGLSSLFPIHYKSEMLNRPGILAVRAGVSVSLAAPADFGAILFDIGGVLRTGASGISGSLSLIF